MAGVIIRPATDTDAQEAAALLRRSITELCAPDHGNDAGRLSQWLSNKTPEHFRDWLADPLNTIIVVERDGHLVAVGGLRDGEGISLNYVHPQARFSGVSSLLLARLEAMLAARGIATARLVATHTALSFYENRGYRLRDLPEAARHPYGIEMEKAL